MKNSKKKTKNSQSKTKKVKLYTCGTDWFHEIGEAIDLEGSMPLYSSIKELKANKPCHIECGIVELNLTFNKWAKNSDFSSLSFPRFPNSDDEDTASEDVEDEEE